MTSSWIPTFPFSFSVPRPFTTSGSVQLTPSEAGGSSTSPPLASNSHSRSQRFPSPPLRGTDTLSTSEGSPNGSKRVRELSTTSEETDGEPDRKKRKRGIVGTVLGTALDAAVFSTALGYSAYQLWKNPPTKDDVDALTQRKQQLMLADRPHSSTSTLVEAPPPYSEQSTHEPRKELIESSSRPRQSVLASSPSQIPRRIRHAHESRPRLSARSSTSSPSSSTTSTLANDSRSASETFSTTPEWTPRDPLANLPSVPLPEFQPYSSPKFNSSFDPEFTTTNQECQEEEEEFEEDEEMKAVSDRLKNLIETGREALASRPREWSNSTTSSSSDPSVPRSRLSTTSSTTTASASPRKPSPLSQFTSRFDSLPATSSSPSNSLAPRHSLPGSSSQHSSPSVHSRRKSLDSRMPSSIPAVKASSSSPRNPASLAQPRGHRHTQSYGGAPVEGITSSQSLSALNERAEGGEAVVGEFEKVLQKSRKARASFGR
ncbi:hypothetical protein JCM3765_001158 [Sporobolomyces pararoseus]